MYSLRFTAHSEVGRVRKNNQDAAYASPTMLVVCDGMGGAAAGDLASAVAATEAARSDRRLEEPEDMLGAMAGIISRANNKLGDLVEEDLSLEGMGTTFCGAMFNGQELAVGHIGDSRGYLLRDGELTQFTHDHSWVQSLIDEGRITPEQAERHPHRSLIMRVLNGQEGFEPDLFPLELAEGDRILFCSDGLSGLVSDDDLAETLRSLDLQEATEELARLANVGGGHDNITLVVADVLPHDDELDALPGALHGSATEVEVPVVGELAAKAGKPSGYPEPPARTLTEATTEEADAEKERYAPKERHGKWPATLLTLVLAALLVGTGAWGIQSYTQSRYFIAADQGRVAIYNGLPGSLLGMPLSQLVESSDVAVEDLPAFHQRAVGNTIAVDDVAAGRATTEQLRELAKRCVEKREGRLRPTQTGPSPSPSPSPTTSVDPLPTGSGGAPAFDVEPGYPTYLAPMTPTASTEADPEHC